MAELPTLPDLVLAGFNSMPLAIVCVIPGGIIGYMIDSALDLVGDADRPGCGRAGGVRLPSSGMPRRGRGVRGP